MVLGLELCGSGFIIGFRAQGLGFRVSDVDRV